MPRSLSDRISPSEDKPVAVARQGHGGGQENAADDGRVDQAKRVRAELGRRRGLVVEHVNGRVGRVMTSPMALADWSVRRPWRALAVWAGFVALAVVLGVAVPTRELPNGAVGES